MLNIKKHCKKLGISYYYPSHFLTYAIHMIATVSLGILATPETEHGTSWKKTLF